MSWRKRLGKLLLFGMLEMGALAGAPITPDQIEKIMKLTMPSVTHVVRNTNGDDPPEKHPDKCPEQNRN